MRASVLRLPMYVWGNAGSYFIPLNIGVAKEHGKSYYILPGMHLWYCNVCRNGGSPDR